MGIVSTTLSQSNNMKFLLVLAVAAYARAEAEAKPGFVYHTGSPVVYNHLPLAYHQAPLVYHHLPAGCQNNQGVAVPALKESFLPFPTTAWPLLWPLPPLLRRRAMSCP